jgi:hypothetical protein
MQKLKTNKRKMNKRATLMGLMISLPFAFMILCLFIALLPGFQTVIELGMNSQGLNCPGYVYQGNAASPLSYNATIGSKSTIGCLALNLYMPYIVIGVMITIVGMIVFDQKFGAVGQQMNPY